MAEPPVGITRSDDGFAVSEPFIETCCERWSELSGFQPAFENPRHALTELLRFRQAGIRRILLFNADSRPEREIEIVRTAV